MKISKKDKPVAPTVDPRNLPKGWFIVHDMQSNDKEVPIDGTMVGALRPYDDRTIINVSGSHTHAREDINHVLQLIQKAQSEV